MNYPLQALSKSNTFLSAAAILTRYNATRSLNKTKQLHAQITSTGLLHTLWPTLFISYARCCGVVYARKVFGEMPDRSVFLYNKFLRMYVECGLYFDAVKLFVEILRFRDFCPDGYMYSCTIKACSELSLVEWGRVVHGKILVSKFGSDVILQNTLMGMYMKCGEKEMAIKVFDTMTERNVVSWNSMISGCFKNGCLDRALSVFDQMMDSGVEIDYATVVSVLPACGGLKKLEMGRRVHKIVEEKSLVGKVEVWNALVDMYAKCGSLAEARLVFDKMVERDVVSWSSMINGYIINGDVRSALELCRNMQSEGIKPNSVTMALLLSACDSSSYMKQGRSMHGWVIRQLLDSEVAIETSLIDMYANCNLVQLSYRVFMRTSRKRVVPWNAILTGYIHNSLATEAVELYKQMLNEGMRPDNATLECLLPAYAILADLQPARNMHCHLTTSGFLSRVEVATCLIDIYSKCGNLESAHQIFTSIPANAKDVVVWSVIIAGYGIHGHGEAAVSLFRQMRQSGLEPNMVTYTSILHACSHAGLVEEGLCIFSSMLNDKHVKPQDEHYACIVDLLGRAGQLDEAYHLIKSMPSCPSYSVWGAFLGACITHGNSELGEVAAQRLFELEPENTGNYILLGKLYSATGRWKEAENVRHIMNDIGIRKTPAHSLIDSAFV